MNPLPSELTPALRDRRRALAASATGKVLDLGGWTDHLDSYRGADVDLLVGDDDGDGTADHRNIHRLAAGATALVDMDNGPYDTVLSLVRLPLVADASRFLATIRSLLADDGRLLLLEPGMPTTVGRVLAALGPLVRVSSGLHLDRDVAADVRAAGFFITDLDRFRVPRAAAPLPFIEARARVRPARS
jgi:hypothetical protein